MRTENLRAKYAAANPKSTWAQCWLSFFAFLTSFFSFMILKLRTNPRKFKSGIQKINNLNGTVLVSFVCHTTFKKCPGAQRHLISQPEFSWVIKTVA
jgi:hypothetical protein